ncbi:tetratricopeptide repeat protein [Novosphingobium sp. ERN07]|nr:tetratricopeptide repeat protein [Novosphingobium sp. ERN07]
MQPKGTPGPHDVLRLLHAGRAADAARLGANVLQRSRPDPALLQIVAIAHIQSGDLLAGRTLLEKARALAPRDPGLAFNYAKVLGDLKDADAALRICAQPEFSNLADFLRLRADLLKSLGRHADAIAAFKRLLQIDPADVAARNNLGNALLESGQNVEAVAMFETALQRAPTEPTLTVNYATALVAARDFAKALPAAERARSIAPQNPLAWQALGRTLNYLRRHQEALPCLVEALRLDPRNAAITVDTALTFVALAEFEKAEQGFRQALTLDPRCAEAYLNLGSLFEQSNRIAELEALLAQADAAGAQGDQILALRAMLARRNGDFEKARDLLVQIAPDGPVDEGLRAQLMGGIADRLGDVQTAYDAFVAMNEATARHPLSADFGRDDYRNYIKSLDGTLDRQWLASWSAAPVAERPSPAFLVGFPRSGTTLLDTVLMGHDRTHVLEEQPIMAAIHEEVGHLSEIANLTTDQVEALREHYFDKVNELAPVPDGAMIIDKLPLNMLRAPLIHRLFPDAKFIFAVRHPCDCVLSCFMQNFHLNRSMASFLDIESAALTYDAALTYWEESRDAMDLNVHQIHYEDLIADTRGETERLVGFLGLGWTEDMLDHQQTAVDRGYIRTPSYAQVTEKIYTRAAGRWERYRQQINHVLPTLDPWAKRYGYGSVFAAADPA